MGMAQPLRAELGGSDQRNLGRAEVAIEAKIEIPRGRFACTLSDLSLEGARIDTNQIVKPGHDVWLVLNKLRVFATVQWQRSGQIGVCFEQKLPKAFVMKLLGEEVDREALEAAETLLAAHDWVVGGTVQQTRSISAADILHARNVKNDGSSYVANGVQWVVLNRETEGDAHAAHRKRVITLFAGAAIGGSIIGLASAFLV